VKIIGLGVVLIVLASILAYTIVPSAAQLATNQTNSTGNKTLINPLPTPIPAVQVNGTIQDIQNYGQQITSLLQQALDLFKQQRAESISIIKDCRAKLATATNDTQKEIRSQCTQELKSIAGIYQKERQLLKELLQAYGNDMSTLIHEVKGTHFNKHFLKGAHEHMMSGEKHMGKIGFMRTINNTKCVNPPGGPMIC